MCSLPVNIKLHCYVAVVWYATPDSVAMPACLWPEDVAAAANTVLCVVCMQSLSAFTLPMSQDLPVIGLSVVVLHCQTHCASYAAEVIVPCAQSSDQCMRKSRVLCSTDTAAIVQEGGLQPPHGSNMLACVATTVGIP